MFYLILLAPVGAIALLVTMSSLERWQEINTHGREKAPAIQPIERGHTS